jgi:hypothetical protein
MGSAGDISKSFVRDRLESRITPDRAWLAAAIIQTLAESKLAVKGHPVLDAEGIRRERAIDPHARLQVHCPGDLDVSGDPAGEDGFGREQRPVDLRRVQQHHPPPGA